MTNPTPNDLSSPAPLSPTAQAIKNAVLALDPDRRTFKWVWSLCRPIAAAAIRAAADQAAPELPHSELDDPEILKGIWGERRACRAELLAIATELEGQ